MDAVKKTTTRALSIKRGEKVIIDANAGSGKTTTLIRAMAVAAFAVGGTAYMPAGRYLQQGHGAGTNRLSRGTGFDRGDRHHLAWPVSSSH